ncbi:PREDICTED: deSI-like protein At4g17486 [Lupinus angustifolius]|uniref:deSI-like protein At4g17486 n=1 Tax=Lupinus angustifolius TaxID=3871 RepID=UPI00092F3546|nr:PREDICTED: deSI-like protein At4g17486 [Lupinus angustifolius]
MFWKKSSQNDIVLGSGSVPVYLNVYDLASINGCAYWAGLGIYHSGVQVHSVEYAFGAHESPSSGIYEGTPKRSEKFRLRKSILIGKTNMGYSEVKDLMKEFGTHYRGNAYHLITKNCNHFCNDVCVKLTGNHIPSWVNRLARIGLMLTCILPVSLKSTKLRDHKIEDNQMQHEGKKQVLTCDSNNVIAFNSTFFSAPSPLLTSENAYRGRNRITRHISLPLIEYSS